MLVPPIFDPPQYKDYYKCTWINWYMHRSPLCVRAPCCCVPVCFKCLGHKSIDIGGNNDSWLKEMLDPSRSSALCPEHLKGAWWMDGNVVGEVLVTFEDAMWRTDKLCIKDGLRNWTRDNSPLGLCLFLAFCTSSFPLRLEISPSGRWMNLDPFWFYVPQPGDEIIDAHGDKLEWAPGDLMRVSWKEPMDPASGLRYQYRVRRIAYRDAGGSLVKTGAFEELVALAKADQEYPSRCCGYGGMPRGNIAYDKALKVMNRRQQVIYAPALQRM